MLEDERFAEFSMEGPRFDARGLPVETAKELGYYRDAIVAVARRLWLDANPENSNVPAHFADAFDLRVTEVRPGSARPQLYLHKSGFVDEDRFVEWRDIYGRARDEVTRAIEAVSEDGSLPENFPRAAVRPLRQMGKTLRDEETIRVGSVGAAARSAALTRDTHSVLKRIDEVLDEPEETKIEGVIYAFDSKAKSFSVRHSDGRSVRCDIQIGREDLVRVAKQYCATDEMDAPDVVVFGYAVPSVGARTAVLSDVHGIQHLRSVSEKMTAAKFTLLESMQDGWGGDGTVAPDLSALVHVRKILPILHHEQIEFSIASEDDGGIVFEWRRGAAECTAVIGTTGTLFLCSDNTDTDELSEASFPYAQATLLGFMRSGEWIE